MADIVLVTIILAFTALCVAYISWCDRIIGTDAAVATDPQSTPQATTEPVTDAAGVRTIGVTS